MVTEATTRTEIVVKRRDGSMERYETDRWRRESTCDSCGQLLPDPVLVVFDKDGNVLGIFKDWADFQVVHR